jgi:hypothetical protein
MAEFNWTCPFCQNAQTVSGEKYHSYVHPIKVGQSKHGAIALRFIATGCSNPNCKEVALTVITGTLDTEYRQAYRLKDKISNHAIWPESSHKPQPTFIPPPIVQDYVEACRIRDLSPKASATLSRRCIQGMIRDFCGISKATLFAEIEELKSRVENNTAPNGVTPETLEAIDHLRSIGNIGAHMEKDINIIVDVDPGEAQALIELIELLFGEWYVARNSRQTKLAKIKSIAEVKAEAKRAEVKPAEVNEST